MADGAGQRISRIATRFTGQGKQARDHVSYLLLGRFAVANNRLFHL